jgi:hypothetical protein
MAFRRIRASSLRSAKAKAPAGFDFVRKLHQVEGVYLAYDNVAEADANHGPIGQSSNPRNAVAPPGNFFEGFGKSKR